MARTKVEAASAEDFPVESSAEDLAEEVKIAPLALELGREDLNALVAKVNEIIDVINK